MSPGNMAILAAIHRLTTALGYSPSIDEICKEAGRSSKGGVHRHVEELERLGFIRRGPRPVRTANNGGSRSRRPIKILRLPPVMGGVCPTCGAEKELA
jgi:SOS-response transcriptional repressor LexA